MTTNQPHTGKTASTESYEDLLLDLNDFLEGGDVALDFEGNARATITISHLMAIIKKELSVIEEQKYMEELVWLVKQRGEQE